MTPSPAGIAAPLSSNHRAIMHACMGCARISSFAYSKPANHLFLSEIVPLLYFYEDSSFMGPRRSFKSRAHPPSHFFIINIWMIYLCTEPCAPVDRIQCIECLMSISRSRLRTWQHLNVAAFPCIPLAPVPQPLNSVRYGLRKFINAQQFIVEEFEMQKLIWNVGSGTSYSSTSIRRLFNHQIYIHIYIYRAFNNCFKT